VELVRIDKNPATGESNSTQFSLSQTSISVNKLFDRFSR